MTDAFFPYLPTLTQITGLLAVLAVVLALLALGAFAGGRRRLAEGDLITGWGLTVVLFTAVGVITEAPFTRLAVALFFIAAVAMVLAYRRDRRVTDTGAARVVLLGVPLLLVTAAMSASQWDEFSQWLWSARYLLEIDAFRRVGLPENPASFPGYPYALPLVMYLASRLAGTFFENSGILFNVFLLLSFAHLLARLMARGVGDNGITPPSFALLALGLVAALVLPPFVVPKIAFTTYAEVGTAVATAFAGVLGWLAVGALAEDDGPRARALAVQMGLALAVLVSLKQANLVLLVLLLGGVMVAGLRTPGVNAWRLARLLALALAAPVAVYLLWRYHVTTQLAGREFAVRPLSEWNFELLPKTLSTMLGIVLRKSGYFAAMAIVAGFALRGLVRYRAPFDGLAIIAGGVFVGYNAFLLFAYLAIFGGWESEHAASYWRYNMHVGPLGGAAAVYGLAILWRTRAAGRPGIGWAWLAIVLVLAAPLALINKVRFDLRAPKQYVRQVGAELTTILPPGARLAIVDPLDPGIYAKLLRYELYRSFPVVAELHHSASAAAILAPLSENKATHAWIHTQSDAVRAAFKADLPEGASYLLESYGEGWRIVRSWPYPGYRLPTDLPD